MILYFILGAVFGIIFMSILQINRLKEIESDIKTMYIEKIKIMQRILELEKRSEQTFDVKIHTLKDTMLYTAEQMRKLL